MKKLLIKLTIAFLGIVIGTNLNAQSFDSWELQNPYPTAVSLYDIQFKDENTGWAVGDFGTILKTTDGGETWQKQNTGSTGWFSHIDVYDENIVYVSGPNDDLIFTENGGETWIELSCPYIYQNFSDIEIVNPDTVWIGNSKGRIIGCFNKGETWFKSIDGYSGSISSIESVGSKKIIALGSAQPPIIKYSDDYGQSWENRAINDSIGAVSDMVFADENTAYLVSTRYGEMAPYRVFKSTDAGETWFTQYLVGFSNQWLKLDFVDANHGWSMTKVSLNRTVDGGETWDNIPMPNIYWWSLNSLSFVNRNIGFVAGYRGRILKTEDSGDSWHYLSRGFHGDIKAICMLNNSSGWALSYDYLLKTDDGGNTWQKDELEITGGWDMFFLDEFNGWMLSEGGTKVWRTSDADRTWKHIGNIEDSHSMNFYFYDENNGWSCRQSGKVFHSINGGVTWAHYFVADNFIARDLVQYENKVWVVGKDLETGYGEVCFSDNGGLSWQIQSSDFGKTYLNSISCSDEGELYVSDGNTLYRSIDDGINWEIILEMDSSTAFSSAVKASGSDEVKVICRSGLLYYSHDNGNSWESSFSGYGPLLGFSFTDENIWIAGESGVIAKLPTLLLGNNQSVAEKTTVAFPNPGSSQLNLVLNEDGNLNMFSVSGQKVLNTKLNRGSNTINTSGLQSGFYFYEIKNKEGKTTQKGKWIKK